jgi:hypothetical protein
LHKNCTDFGATLSLHSFCTSWIFAQNCTGFFAQGCHYLQQNTCKQKDLFTTLRAMNGNETPLAPLAGKVGNEAFAGSNPAPRTICPFFVTPRQRVWRKASRVSI